MTVGKLKGGQWERDVNKQLSLWISSGTRDDIFCRSSMSGGRATIGLKKGLKRKAQAGDVSAVDSLGEQLLDYYIIENKFYKDLDIIQGITKDSGLLYQFWNHHKGEASIYDKFPVLIAKQNYVPALCLMYEESLIHFGLTNDHILMNLIRWPCVVLLFDCFLRDAQLPKEALVISNRRLKL